MGFVSRSDAWGMRHVAGVIGCHGAVPDVWSLQDADTTDLIYRS
jgi:hypothetical protein